MTLEQCYEQLRGNYGEAKQRLMTERLMEKFLLKFLDDPTMGQLREAVKVNDHETAFRAAHTLKGVAANLAFTDLQRTASDLTEQLRPGGAAADRALLAKVEESYARVCDTIHAYQAEK